MPRAPEPASRRWERRAALLALALGLVAATYPAWRVLTLGPEPTLDELRQVLCAGPVDGPPSWARPQRR